MVKDLDSKISDVYFEELSSEESEFPGEIVYGKGN